MQNFRQCHRLWPNFEPKYLKALTSGSAKEHISFSYDNHHFLVNPILLVCAASTFHVDSSSYANRIQRACHDDQRQDQPYSCSYGSTRRKTDENGYVGGRGGRVCAAQELDGYPYGRALDLPRHYSRSSETYGAGYHLKRDKRSPPKYRVRHYNPQLNPSDVRGTRIRMFLSTYLTCRSISSLSPMNTRSIKYSSRPIRKSTVDLIDRQTTLALPMAGHCTA